MGKFQSEFDAASAEDKAYAIAVHRAQQRMAAWENQRAIDDAKRQGK